MANRWTLVTLGIAALGATSLTSTLTTAYLMRPPAPEAAVEPTAPEPVPDRRPAIVEIAPGRPAVTGARGPARTLAVLGDAHRAPAAAAEPARTGPAASRAAGASPNAAPDASTTVTPAPPAAFGPTSCAAGALPSSAVPPVR